MSDRDLRKSQRIAVELPMKLTAATGEEFVIRTWDFSDKGVFLTVSDDVLEYALVDSVVKIQFQGTNFKPPVMVAKVIRTTDKGIALELRDTLVEGDAS